MLAPISHKCMYLFTRPVKVTSPVTSPNITDEELWNAQYAVFGRIHPDTKKVVPLPFSMTGLVKGV